MKPADLYIGVSELFSILLPGLVVSWIVLFGPSLTPGELPEEVAGWIGFSIFAYMVGHILFGFGAKWDRLYDKFYRPDKDLELIPRIARIRGLPEDFDMRRLPVNGYQWAKAVLVSRHPDGYQEVIRHEADSKLFRSLLFPLIAATGAVLFDCASGASCGLEQTRLAIALILATLLAYWCFRRQRCKACVSAYVHVIVLHQLGLLPAVEPEQTDPEEVLGI